MNIYFKNKTNVWQMCVKGWMDKMKNKIQLQQAVIIIKVIITNTPKPKLKKYQ